MKNLPSEEFALVGVIDPDAYSAATYTTSWVAAKDWRALQGLVSVGTLGSSATVDAKIEQAKDGSGTGAKDLSGAAITQLTEVGSDGDKQAMVEFRPEDLDVANGFTHVRLSVTVAVATSDAAAYLFGFGPRYSPASDHDASTVDEVVTV